MWTGKKKYSGITVFGRFQSYLIVVARWLPSDKKLSSVASDNHLPIQLIQRSIKITPFLCSAYIRVIM